MLKRNKKRLPINVLGVKLKEGREKLGLSQEEVVIQLAEYGFTVKDLNEWENGYDLPKEKFVMALANLYNIDSNELIRIIKDIEFVGEQKNRTHKKKFLGRTFWDVFGEFIIKLFFLTILILIIYLLIKFNVFRKIKKEFEFTNNTDTENYIVDDEYLRMLNSKNGQKIKTREND